MDYDQLRPHQQKAVSQLRAEWKDKRTHLVYASVAFGKTALASYITQSFVERGMRVMFIAPYTVLVEQTAKRFHEYGLPPAGIVWRDHPEFYPQRMVQIASADTLIRRDWPDNVDLIIVDECFPAGTMVDGVAIENIRPGDYVTSFNEKTGEFSKNIVEATHKIAPKSPIVSLYIKGHNRIDCTTGHPFYTKRGWVHAAELKQTDEILTYELEKSRKSLRYLWERVCNFLRPVQKREGEADNKSVLLKGMHFGIQKENWGPSARENDCKQPNEKPKNTREGIRHVSKDWTQTAYTTREWSRANRSGDTSNEASKIFRFRISSSSKNRMRKGRQWLSNMLQVGFGKQKTKAWDRGGWTFSLLTKKTRSGQKEGRVPCWKRLDNLEIRQQRDYWKYSGSSSEGYVYNLQIANDNTYVANGVVVHNCHIRRKKLLEIIRDIEKPVIGLSGTPFSPWLGEYYESLIKPCTMRELIDQGYLSDYEFYAPTKPDLKGVKSRPSAGFGVDYVEADVAEIMGEYKLVGDIVSNWLANGENLPTIAFCCNVLHAGQIANEFSSQGVTCEVMTAKTPKDERDHIVKRFEAGLVKVICNVGVLVAGFDSDVRCIIYARPTKSEIRWIQCLGRGLRAAHGKDRCLIFDHSGTVHRLGFPDQIEYDELPKDSDGQDEQKRKEKEIERLEKLPKECKRCKYLKPVGVAKCPKCGHQARAGEDVDTDVSRELQKLTGKAVKLTREDKQKIYSELLGYKKERDASGKPISIGWVSHKYKEKTGVWPKDLQKYPRVPSPEMRKWIQSQNIRFAKSRKKVIA